MRPSFRFFAKDPHPTKQKSYGCLTGRGSEPEKADFTSYSGIFQSRSGPLRLEGSLDVAFLDKHIFTPADAHRIGADFAKNVFKEESKLFSASNG
jgi:hypothetical protein